MKVGTGLVLVNTSKLMENSECRVPHFNQSGFCTKADTGCLFRSASLGMWKEDVNFKKQVIYSKHWSCGERLNLEDFPSIKFTESGSQESPKVK